jgi:hypothetical protein
MDSAHVLYAFRNDLWKVGSDLLESDSRKDQRYGQFLTDLGYLLANHYQEKPDAVFDDTWRESMRESMRSSARFAQNVRLD